MNIKLTNTATYATAVITLVNITSQIIAFFYRVALVRLVGAEVMGLYQLIVPVYAVIMSLVATGLTVAVSRLSAEYTAVGQYERTHQLVRKALRLFFVAFLIVAAVVALFSDGISVVLIGDARTHLGLLVLLACIFFTGVENIYKNYFYGIKNIHPPALSEMVEQIVRSCAVLFLVWQFPQQHAEYTIALIVAGLVACEVVSSMLLRWLYMRHKRNARAGIMCSQNGVNMCGRQGAAPAHRREILNIAIPVSISAVALNLISSANAVIIPERLMASGLSSIDALSHYGVIFGMVLPLIALPMACIGALTLVMSPRISEAVAQDNKRLVSLYVSRSLRVTTIIMLPMLTLLALFGQPIVNALFANSVDFKMMALLCISFLFSSYQVVTASILNAVGKQKRAAANVMAAGLVQLLITWYTVAQPSLRLLGVVIAMLIGGVMALLLNALDVRAWLRKKSA
ncbi:MAG: polysaccharide biosynthesis protein [Oscillospiraceae bacterium]|nr:polysaccharide biosynthesis protein [Oscillospiraceae bacterium]